MGGWRSWLVLVLVAAATGACAADGDRPPRAAHDAGPSTVDTSVDPAVSTTEARPRLRHTVTLGESFGGEPAEHERVAPASGGPSTVIVVVEPSYGSWGYGAPGWIGSPGWDEWSPDPGWHGRVPAEPSVRPTAPRPWTPPPQYGPRFPFKTAPADPWR